MTKHANEQLCYCGCGEHRGEHAEFVPGHDGKLRGQLDSIMRGEIDESQIATITVEHRNEIKMIKENNDYRKILERAARQTKAATA